MVDPPVQRTSSRRARAALSTSPSSRRCASARACACRPCYLHASVRQTSLNPPRRARSSLPSACTCVRRSQAPIVSTYGSVAPHCPHPPAHASSRLSHRAMLGARRAATSSPAHAMCRQPAPSHLYTLLHSHRRRLVRPAQQRATCPSDALAPTAHALVAGICLPRHAVGSRPMCGMAFGMGTAPHHANGSRPRPAPLPRRTVPRGWPPSRTHARRLAPRWAGQRCVMTMPTCLAPSSHSRA